jgi:hypothetical protein
MRFGCGEWYRPASVTIANWTRLAQAPSIEIPGDERAVIPIWIVRKFLGFARSCQGR